VVAQGEAGEGQEGGDEPDDAVGGHEMVLVWPAAIGQQPDANSH